MDGRSALPGTLAQLQPLCCSSHRSLKASEAPEQDEDEGFADWCQKPEQRLQHCRTEEPPETESTEGDQEDRQVGSSLEMGLPGGGCLQAPQPGSEQWPSLPFPASPPKGPRGCERGRREEESETEGGRRGAAGRGGEEISFLGSPGPWAPSRPAAAGGPLPHLQPTYVMEALAPAARPFLPRGWLASIPTEGSRYFQMCGPESRPGGQAFQMCRRVCRSELGRAGSGGQSVSGPKMGAALGASPPPKFRGLSCSLYSRPPMCPGPQLCSGATAGGQGPPLP